MELLKEVLTALLSAQKLGPMSIVGTVVLFSLRVLKHFAPSLWDKLPWYAKFGLPFVAAFAGTLLLSFSGGWLPALGAALTAGLGAVGLHHASKAAGQRLAPKLTTPLTPMREMGLKLLLDAEGPPPDNLVSLRRKP